MSRNPLLREVEEWTGHRRSEPLVPMKIKVILFSLAAFVTGVLLSSCSFQVNPDGSKSGMLDGPGVLRAIEILNQK